MKRFFLLVCILFFGITNAQTEYRISLDSGLYSYGGEGASSSSNMIIDAGKHYGYTENPYGTNNGFCYGLSVDLRHINTSKTIFGIAAGYEILRSKTTILLVQGDTSSFSGGANGFYAHGSETVATNYNVTAFPYAGRRFMANKTPIDLVLGMDIAYILGSQEKGAATTVSASPPGTVIISPTTGGDINTIPILGAGDGYKTTYTSSNNIYTTSFDFRPRIQVATYYYNFGLYLGYSYGLVNYNTKPKDGANTGNAFSRMIRFGVTYKLF